MHIFAKELRTASYTAANFFICLFLLTATVHAYTVLPEDNSSAVIFVYQTTDEDFRPDLNIKTSQFDAHLNELKNQNYNIVSLLDIVNAFKNDTSLPSRTIAITFDGGYKSAFVNAMPKLLDANIPFTVFVSPAQLDQNSSRYMDWNDLKSIAKSDLVTIGLHSASYERLYEDDNLNIDKSIKSAKSRLRDVLKEEAEFFAYPFGEYNETYKKIIKQNGFKAAFGQQSSVAHLHNDLYAIPRFTLTENHASVDRFQLLLNALPLPVTNVNPQDTVLNMSNLQIGFSVPDDLKTESRALSCFATDQGKLDAEKIGDTRYEFYIHKTIQSKRIRMNCTLPVTTETGETIWRWYGNLFILNETASNTIAAPIEP